MFIGLIIDINKLICFFASTVLNWSDTHWFNSLGRLNKLCKLKNLAWLLKVRPLGYWDMSSNCKCNIDRKKLTLWASTFYLLSLQKLVFCLTFLLWSINLTYLTGSFEVCAVHVAIYRFDKSYTHIRPFTRISVRKPARSSKHTSRFSTTAMLPHTIYWNATFAPSLTFRLG